ncbi:hybrid sensor histidine kinase/response regulator [Burkholderia sp. Ax-1719]|uniref:hybrid sensor histidine kinase/response regulator n=1 Tax=Burkholderia sp. Ax-1719 TaxID=2608334 RepID=UPI00141E3DA7|nr:hybrid sensor histidine kinase/response regulator [Burkholderia sp. Ax-1719]NIE63411.1 HAMP domain-containing histidine kinase [Burkholderia sp. Ax-1719]
MTQPSAAPLSILFVDDDELSRVHFERAIDGTWPVHLARNAEEAMAILARHHAEIAVLVTDFRMPTDDGASLLGEAAKRYPHIVGILVTAYADKDMLLQTVNSGNVFRVLEKPLRVSAIRGVVREALSRHGEREAHQQRLLAMNETLAFLAHELNTPLATIALFAGNVQNNVADLNAPTSQADIAQAATLMLNNAQYCMALISSFWDTLNKSSSTASLAPESGRDATATKLVSALLDSWPFSASQRDWISVDLKSDFVVHSMPNCVVLVLSSLLANALRALAHTAAPALRIEIVGGSAPEIRVHDNGTGIPPEVQARLLRDPVTTHAQDGGHGMGMIFCNRVMRSLRGGLKIESTWGEGTTVTMSFGEHNAPAAAATVAAAEPLQSSANERRESPNPVTTTK